METTYSIKMTKGYSGMNAKYVKGYMARITGTHAEYGMARSFLKGKADSDAPYRKSKCSWNDVYTLGAGLYEVSEGGDRKYIVAWSKADRLAVAEIPAARAQAIAALLDAGTEFEAARLATRPATA